MPGADAILNAFVTLLVIVDPVGLAAIFLALTDGMNGAERRQVATRSTIIGFAILTLFALAGAGILSLLGITLPAFRVAGGLLLFYIAFEMVFERRQERHEKSTQRAITKDMIRNIAVFPLSIPLIAGPGAISATILLSDELTGPAAKSVLIGIILAVLVLTWIVFLLSGPVNRLLGETGRSILTRLLGVILAALSVQFVTDGVRAIIAG